MAAFQNVLMCCRHFCRFLQVLSVNCVKPLKWVYPRLLLRNLVCAARARIIVHIIFVDFERTSWIDKAEWTKVLLRFYTVCCSDQRRVGCIWRKLTRMSVTRHWPEVESTAAPHAGNYASYHRPPRTTSTMLSGLGEITALCAIIAQSPSAYTPDELPA